MLSEKLKNKDLDFAKVTESRKRKEAKDMLAETAEMLVIAMRTAEDYGSMSRDEVEGYTLKCIEFYEAKYYSVDDFKKTVSVIVERGMK